MSVRPMPTPKLNNEYMEKTKHLKPDAVKYLKVLSFVCNHWINKLIFILKKIVLDSVSTLNDCGHEYITSSM